MYDGARTWEQTTYGARTWEQTTFGSALQQFSALLVSLPT